MFSDQQVRQMAPLMKALEEEEPLVSAWRTQGGNPPRLSGLVKMVRSCARWGRDGLRRLRAPARPDPGQVVVFPTGLTPSSWGSLRPLLFELARRGSPAFLVTNHRTRPVLAQGLHKGFADIGEIGLANSRFGRFRHGSPRGARTHR